MVHDGSLSLLELILIHRDALSARAGLVETAHDGRLACQPTKADVVIKVAANTSARRLPPLTIDADAPPRVAEWGWFGADVAARAAVFGIGIKVRAGPAAVRSARDAVVGTKSRDAGDGLVDTGRPAALATPSAVVDVILQTGAMTAATALPGGAADVIAARPADAAGVALARPPDLEALRLLRPFAALTEALHTSCLPAHAVSKPRGASTAPANTAPSRRSDSRRGTDSASDFENSSKRFSMTGSFC